MSKDFSYKFFSTTASAWEAMFAAITNAEKLVYWELYMLMDDVQGDKFIDLLCAKARAGVDVKLILDAIGSIEFSRNAENRLRAAGVELLWYNPILSKNIFNRWRQRIWQRNHRKVLIVDGQVGFIGGVNVHATQHDWLDVHLQITGSAVRSLLYGFARSYVHSGGSRKKMRKILHPFLVTKLELWKNKIKFIFNAPDGQSKRKLRETLYNSIEPAQKSITLLSPYYAPDRDFMRLLERAARRGVRIDLIMPARTDMEFMELIAQKYFAQMQKWGVNIYFSEKMNHGKAMVVDDKVGMVGSANLTKRSFDTNAEAGVYFTNEDMVADLNKILDDWKQAAKPFSAIKLHAKGWYRTIKDRVKEWVANKIEKYV